MNLYEQVQSQIKTEVELKRREKALQERENRLNEMEKDRGNQTVETQQNDSMREQIRKAIRGEI